MQEGGDILPENPVIGVMSGSSLDGIDVCAVTFTSRGEELVEWSLLHAETYPLEGAIKGQLQNADRLSAKDLAILDVSYGRVLGNIIADFVERYGISNTTAAVHGHTVFHIPGKGVSMQIGHGGALAQHAGMTVITDFRSSDVSVGGQGAPFAPIADRDLFPGYRYYLNLGGIANLSLVNSETVAAADVAPCNQILNFLAMEMQLPFDDKGWLARKGSLKENLLLLLKEAAPPLKASAFAMTNQEVRNKLFPVIKTFQATVEEKLHTMCVFIAERIKAWVFLTGNRQGESTAGKMLCTGGGAHNAFLMELIKQQLKETGVDCVLPAPEIIDFKEAILMAWLGWLRLNGRPNTLPSVTGAVRATSGGAIYLAS